MVVAAGAEPSQRWADLSDVSDNRRCGFLGTLGRRSRFADRALRPRGVRSAAGALRRREWAQR
eukprot:7851552-Lingulodinium_polyedra.AAC.1